MWRKSLLITLIIYTIITVVDSYPNGAPETVCDTLLPFHGGGIPPLTSTPPYRIESSSQIIGQGQTIELEIVPVISSLSFGGFMIQARNVNPPYQVIGQFEDDSSGVSKFLNCGSSQTTATHTSTATKTLVNLKWKAPVDFLGEFVFNSTVANHYDRFWVGIESPRIRIKREDTLNVVRISTTRSPLRTTIPIYIPTVRPLVKQRDPFYLDCGRTKTCFGMPDGCIRDESCKSMASVFVRADKYQFELKTIEPNAQYVALGLSHDNKMGDDSVVECVRLGNQTAIYSSWNLARPNLGVTRTDVPQSSARPLASASIDNSFYCRFERSPMVTVRGKRFDLTSDKFYLLLAVGESVHADGAGYHNLGRLPSNKAIYLSEVQDISGSSTLLLRLHGTFMLIAWIGTTSVGIVLARYFKQAWRGSQLCGKDQWFAWHRICMVVTWALTVAAFVIIFVELNGWSAERNPHAILGVITSIICFFQPIAALLRPSPNSKNRVYFNWGHWLAGNIAHILAIITIFYAVKLTKAQLPEWFDFLLVVYVIFHVIQHLFFSIAACVSDRKPSQRINSFPMADMQRGNNGIVTNDKSTVATMGVRKTMLAVYVVLLTLLVVAMIMIVALAPIEDTVKNLRTKIMENQ